MLLVQPAIPLSAEVPVAPLPELAAAHGAAAAGSAAALPGVIGADPLPGLLPDLLWPLGTVPGPGDAAGATPWLAWPPGGETTGPGMVPGSVGAPPAAAAASEPFSAASDLGGMALLLGGLLVLAGWRHARR